jgi:hypothetical protein
MVNYRVLWHAANLWHGAKGFTSLLKEGMLRFFLPEKIRRLRPGENLRSWVPEASMLTTRLQKPLCNRYLRSATPFISYRLFLLWYLCAPQPSQDVLAGAGCLCSKAEWKWWNNTQYMVHDLDVYTSFILCALSVLSFYPFPCHITIFLVFQDMIEQRWRQQFLPKHWYL